MVAPDSPDQWLSLPLVVATRDNRYNSRAQGSQERQVQARCQDRNQKKVPRYGAAGIAESWLIDLITRRIERYTEPRPVGYRQVLIARSGEALTSTVVPGLTLAVDAIIR